MTTIINTPQREGSDGSALGVILSILVFILLAALFMFYGLPQLRSQEAPKENTTEINVTVPKINEPAQNTNQTSGSVEAQ